MTTEEILEGAVRIQASQINSLIGERDALQQQLAETQAMTRELLAGAIKYHDQQECAWCYDDGQCDLADTIAKGKNMLPAPPSLGKISTT